MKKRIIKTGVLAVVFIAALFVSSLLLNRSGDDEIIDMGAPTLPRISFLVNGQNVNTLFGYVDEMDITAMRDTITPLEIGGTLPMNIETNGNEINGIQYTVYSLDGTETLKEGEAAVPAEGDTVRLELGDALDDSAREAVLEVTLSSGEKDIRYFTRIEKPDNLDVAQSLEFVQDFHTKALEKSASDELSLYLEPGEESDNTTYQTVNIHSDITHIQWGDLNPQVISDVEWSIKECNSVYTSVLATYRVSCEDDNGVTQNYDVREFFRVRVGTSRVYVLDYNRDMQQIFSGGSDALSENGILLGIASEDVQYETNTDETMVAFVQDRDLWLYNKETGEMSQIFSFANREGRDARSRNDQHEVRIVSMDDGGNLAFAVYGYMNRGNHEGEVGVAIYYYSVNRNTIEEKAFIPSTKSFAIAEDELGKMVYYTHSQGLLYVLAEGTLYQVDLEQDEQIVLAENLAEGQYAVSDDGQLMAYQADGSLNTATQIQVMNLKTGENYTVNADAGEAVRPLGFVNGDFIYGKIRSEDAGRSAAEEEMNPMYELVICNEENASVASYSFTDQNIYITDILIEENMVTVNRVAKSGDVYSVTGQEYITNNEERTESTVSVDSYSSDRMGKQMRIRLSDGIADTSASVLKPNQRITGNALTITISGTSENLKFYVYGMGELVAVYDRASYAIQHAQDISGVVISSDQDYVWESGNRDLVYSTDVESFRAQDGENSLDACERFMEQYENAKRIDLSGCTLEQVLYVINKGRPVIALTSTDHAVLLTGYTRTDITYIDPENGEERTVGISEMENMTQTSGNTFIAYI